MKLLSVRYVIIDLHPVLLPVGVPKLNRQCYVLGIESVEPVFSTGNGLVSVITKDSKFDAIYRITAEVYLLVNTDLDGAEPD